MSRLSFFSDADGLVAQPDLVKEGGLLFKRVPEAGKQRLFYPSGHDTFLKTPGEIDCKKLQDFLRQKTDIRPIALEAYLKKQISKDVFIFLVNLQNYVIDYVDSSSNPDQARLRIKVGFLDDQNRQTRRWVVTHLVESFLSELHDTYAGRKTELRKKVVNALESLSHAEKMYAIVPTPPGIAQTMSYVARKFCEEYGQYSHNLQASLQYISYPDPEIEAGENLALFQIFREAGGHKQYQRPPHLPNSLLFPIVEPGKSFPCFLLTSLEIHRLLRDIDAVERLGLPAESVSVAYEPMFGVLNNEDIRDGFMALVPYRPWGLHYPSLSVNKRVHLFANTPAVSYQHDYAYHFDCLWGAVIMCPNLLKLLKFFVERVEHLSAVKGNSFSGKICDFALLIHKLEGKSSSEDSVLKKILHFLHPYQQGREDPLGLYEYVFLFIADLIKNANLYNDFIKKYLTAIAEKINNLDEWIELIIGSIFFLTKSGLPVIACKNRLMDFSENIIVFCMCCAYYLHLEKDDILYLAEKLSWLEKNEKIQFKWNTNDGIMLNFLDEKLSFRFISTESKDTRKTRVYSDNTFCRLFSSQTDEWLAEINIAISQYSYLSFSVS